MDDDQQLCPHGFKIDLKCGFCTSEDIYGVVYVGNATKNEVNEE